MGNKILFLVEYCQDDEVLTLRASSRNKLFNVFHPGARV